MESHSGRLRMFRSPFDFHELLIGLVLTIMFLSRPELFLDTIFLEFCLGILFSKYGVVSFSDLLVDNIPMNFSSLPTGNL